MNGELWIKHRPTSLKQIVGQPEAVKVVEGHLNKGWPHFTIFAGPSGTGKTTIARIVAGRLGAKGRDLIELNCADVRGIDAVREITDKIGYKSLKGGNRVWIIDEAHRLTGEAQDAFLKTLEEPPAHAYFVFCTTNPNKLIAAIKTRGPTVKLKLVNPNDLRLLCDKVATAEGFDFEESILTKAAELADGSPRQALVLLGVAAAVEPEARLDVLQRQDLRKFGIDLARMLFRPYAKWRDVAAVLKDLDEEVETVRRIVLGYADTILLSGSKLAGRAFVVIETFRDPWYDCGKAGLTASCYRVINTK